MSKLTAKSVRDFAIGGFLGAALAVAVAYWLAFGVDSNQYARENAASSLCGQIKPFVAKVHADGHKVSNIEELRAELSAQDEKDLYLIFEDYQDDRREYRNIAMGDVTWEYSSEEDYEFRVSFESGTVVIRKRNGTLESRRFVSD